MLFKVFRDGENIGTVETSMQTGSRRWESVLNFDLLPDDTLENVETGERFRVKKNDTGGYLHSALDMEPLG